jgi:hypothetical protein
MQFDKREMIGRLKLEIEVIERGGYYPSVREPRSQPRIFRDSVTCLNMGLEHKVEPCSHCFLMKFVPLEHQNAEDPCRFIPLNDAGETVATLEDAGRSEEAQEALLNWLRATVTRLETEVAREARTDPR